MVPLVTLTISMCAPPALPSPSLTPVQVVEAQLSALQQDDVQRCFAFASPANRAMTGPWQRFDLLIRQTPAYAPLVACTRYMVVGALPTAASKFRVRVRVWPAGGSSAPFAVAVPVLDYDWSLTRQAETDDDFADCWMVDAVMPDAAPRDAWDSAQSSSPGEDSPDADGD